MNRKEQAEASFKEGFSCSQAVLAAFSDEFRIPRETALRISQGFGGGMARMAETCGALTGAFMVIGLKHGRTRAEDDAAKEKTYALCHELVRRFRARHGSLLCRDLLRLRHRNAGRSENRTRRKAPRRSLPPARRFGRGNPGGSPLSAASHRSRWCIIFYLGPGNMSANLEGSRFFIKTFGCQMNENDSEHVAGLLVQAGAAKALSVEESDIILVNTCAVRKKSEEKIYSFLGRLSPLKKDAGQGHRRPGLRRPDPPRGVVQKKARDRLHRRPRSLS